MGFRLEGRGVYLLTYQHRSIGSLLRPFPITVIVVMTGIVVTIVVLITIHCQIMMLIDSFVPFLKYSIPQKPVHHEGPLYRGMPTFFRGVASMGL